MDFMAVENRVEICGDTSLYFETMPSRLGRKPYRLWATLPYVIRIEIFQHLDVRNYQRLKRVSKEWTSEILLVPRYNCGTVFITWKNIKWSKKNSLGWTRVEWSKWFKTKFDCLSWTDLLGCSLPDIEHIVCEGAFPFVCFAGTSEYTGMQPKLTFATFPHRLRRVTVVSILLGYVVPLFDGSEDPELNITRHSGVKDFLATVADSVVFIHLTLEIRNALYNLWMILRFGHPTIVDISMFRCNASGLDGLYPVPSIVRQVARVVFDMDTYQKYSFGPEGYFHFYPWMSDVLVSNGVLWNYPEAQTHWLQQCMDMLPVVTEETKIDGGWDFWTRDAVRYRLSVSEIVRDFLHVRRDAFPKSTVSFEGYHLDFFECEIFSAWFLATKDWNFRRMYYRYKCGNSDTSASFTKVHPNYPCPPCLMIGKIPVPEEFPYDDWRHKFSYLSTLRAQTAAHPHPTWLDARNCAVEVNRRARRYFGGDAPWIIRRYRTNLRYFFPWIWARARRFLRQYDPRESALSELETDSGTD